MALTCPICGAAVVPEANRSFPFCSRRCREIDLRRWLGENYRFATTDAEDDPAADELAEAQES